MKRSLKLLLLQFVLCFLSPNHLFKYFKRRYSSDQIACLNQTLSLRGKLNSVSLNLCFLRKCSLFGVAPKRIQSRVRKAKVYHSLKIEKAFLKDEIDRSVWATTCWLQEKVCCSTSRLAEVALWMWLPPLCAPYRAERRETTGTC